MTDYSEKTIDSFLDEVASSSPVPGGGGVSALAGALSASLGEMVCSLTSGKNKYREYQEDIERIASDLAGIRSAMADCISRDAEAFEPLSRAYSMDRSDPDRDGIMEECLKSAASVPHEVLSITVRIIPLLEELVIKGSSIAVSDVAVAAAMCRAAAQGAAANTYANTMLMKERVYAEKLDRETSAQLASVSSRADSIFQTVTGRMH